MTAPDMKRKIVLLGDSAVGKTSLIRRFVTDTFDDKYITTIGTKVTKKELTLSRGDKKTTLALMIWDVLGQQGYTGTQAMSYVGTHGAMFVFDLTRPASLASIEKYWLPELTKVAGAVPGVIAGNKVDLVTERKVTDEELREFGQRLGMPCMLSSARTGEGVEAVFSCLGSLVLEPVELTTKKEPDEKKAIRTLTDAADALMTDFTETFGDHELAMSMVRKQFSKAGVDISHPTKRALLEAVRLLAEAEQGFKSPEEVAKNAARRRALIERACQAKN